MTITLNIPDSQEKELVEIASQRGLDDFAAGRHRPAEQIFKDMNARYGISG